LNQCHLVSFFPRAFFLEPLNLKSKALHSFETAGTSYPTTERQILKIILLYTYFHLQE
jgi:hypothetical protein